MLAVAGCLIRYHVAQCDLCIFCLTQSLVNAAEVLVYVQRSPAEGGQSWLYSLIHLKGQRCTVMLFRTKDPLAEPKQAS